MLFKLPLAKFCNQILNQFKSQFSIYCVVSGNRIATNVWHDSIHIRKREKKLYIDKATTKLLFFLSFYFLNLFVSELNCILKETLLYCFSLQQILLLNTFPKKIHFLITMSLLKVLKYRLKMKKLKKIVIKSFYKQVLQTAVTHLIFKYIKAKCIFQIS